MSGLLALAAQHRFRNLYNQLGAPVASQEMEYMMDRETAIKLLQEISTDERFAAALARVSLYAVGKSPLRTYWVIRVNPLNDRSRNWLYVETPGDWHRLAQATPQ